MPSLPSPLPLLKCHLPLLNYLLLNYHLPLLPATPKQLLHLLRTGAP